MMMLTHLDWQPAILLKVVRMPFAAFGGLSLKRAYLALHAERLVYADWTLEAVERSEALTLVTGWKQAAPLELPVKLEGIAGQVIPSGTWLLPYSEGVFQLYSTTILRLNRLLKHIDHNPNEPQVIASLIRLNTLL
jgi:hypothetical protein